MSLIAGATYTYKESVTDNRSIITTIRNKAEEQGWNVLDYVTGTWMHLVLKSPDGSFCLAFNELTNVAGNVYNVELQIFKDYDINKSIHSQLLSIQKQGYKGYTENKHPPQLVGGDTGQTLFLQITPDYITIVLETTNGNYTTLYGGRFLSYAEKEQYDLPLFAGGSGQAEDNVIARDTPCDSYLDSLSFDTFSNFPFGRRDLPTNSSWKSGDYFLTPDGRWQELGSGASGSVDNYPTLSTSNVPVYFQNATIFPLSALMYSTQGDFSGIPILRPVMILSQPEYLTEKTTIMGEVFNIFKVEHSSRITDANNTITIDNEEYFIFDDVYRDQNLNNMFALKVI